MRKIHEFEEIKSKVSSSKGYISNCYWLPGDYLKAIQKGQLLEAEASGGYAWVQQNEGRNQFYYQVSKECTDSFECKLPDDMDFVSEIIHFAKLSEKNAAERSILSKCGFQFHDLVRMMKLKPSGTEATSENHHSIRQAMLQDFESISTLLISSFDTLTDAIPVGEDLKTAIKNGSLWVIGDAEPGRVLGCAMFEPDGRKVWIRHVAVDPMMRGKGIAKEMLLTVIAQGTLVTEYYLWVKDTNKAAISLYNRIGFEETIRQMDIWTKKRN